MQCLKNGSPVSDLQISFAASLLAVFVFIAVLPAGADKMYTAGSLIGLSSCAQLAEVKSQTERRGEPKIEKTSCCLINWRLCQMPTGYRCSFLHS